MFCLLDNKERLNLQFFAATDVVNVMDSGVQGSYNVNAITGEAGPVSKDNNLTPEVKEFYDTDLLHGYRTQLMYAQFGKRQALPRNHGKVVEFRKINRFKKGDKLQEGVIPVGQKLGMEAIKANVGQYGTYVAVSDILEMRAQDPIILACVEEMAESAATTHEMLIRDALAAGTNVIYADAVAEDGTVTPVTSREELGADPDASYLLTPTLINKVFTAMRKNHVPFLEGTMNYAMVCHPSAIYDLRESEDWLNITKYTEAGVQKLFNGEVGMLHGIRILANPDAPVVGENLVDSDTPCKVTIQALTTAGNTVTLTDGLELADIDCLKGVQVYVGVETEPRTIVSNTLNTITLDGEARTYTNGTEIIAAAAAGNGQHVYLSYAFGRDGYAMVDPDGESGTLEVIVKGKEYGGPLNQFSTIGYKFETNGATILYEERVTRVETLSYFASEDEAN